MMLDQPVALSLHRLNFSEIHFVQILLAPFFCTLRTLVEAAEALTSEETKLLLELTMQKPGTAEPGVYQQHSFVF
jgi:hypothetical protein